MIPTFRMALQIGIEPISSAPETDALSIRPLERVNNINRRHSLYECSGLFANICGIEWSTLSFSG